MRPSIAERLFDADSAESELEETLTGAGIAFERLGWDWYDCSLELYEVPDAERLSPEAQKIIHDAGFSQVYVNHLNNWETHYKWPQGVFKVLEGWRVSYPHKRGDGEKGIWVEKPIAAWPQKWFETGYVSIKEPGVS